MGGGGFAEVQSGVEEPDVFAVVFHRVVEIRLSLDVPPLGFGEEKGIFQVLDVICHRHVACLDAKLGL